MLVLTRKVGERILIGEKVVLTIVRIHGDKIRIGVEAPPEVAVHREEVYRRVQRSLGPAPGTVPAPGTGA